jgi:hypothetical protein
MKREWHKGLTLERWATFPAETRVAMIENEVSRARNAQRDGFYDSTRLALERALELLDLTVETPIERALRHSLLRWRERLAKAWLFPEDPIQESLQRPG